MPAFTNNLEIVMLHKLAKVLQISLGGGIGCKHVQDITIGKFANLISHQHKWLRAAQTPRIELNVVFHRKPLVKQGGMLGHLGRDSHQVLNANMIIAKTSGCISYKNFAAFLL